MDKTGCVITKTLDMCSIHKRKPYSLIMMRMMMIK